MNGSLLSSRLVFCIPITPIISLLVDSGRAWEFDREMLGMMILRSLEKLI